jgi:four helix bundle protein
MEKKLPEVVASYKDLFVWQRSMDLVVTVYEITAGLPDSEQFGLISQLRRCTVSIPSNIAEGYGRQRTGEYRHHLLISRGSLLELETQLLLCQRLNYLSEHELAFVFNEITEISKMLGSLISKLS